MATKNDVWNYSGCSFEDLIDLVLKFEAENKELQEAYDEVNGELFELKAKQEG